MNYPVVELGDICDEIYRYPSFYGMEHFSTGVPVIRGEHIDPWGNISQDWSDYWFVSDEVSSQFPRTVLREGDLVFTVRGTIGKVGLITKSHDGAQLSPNLIRFSPKREVVDTIFLWYFLQSIKETAAADIQNEVTIASVRASDLSELKIPLPPLTEQKRIASLLARADRLRQLRRTAHDLSDSVLQSVFLEMFEKERRKIKIVKLGSLADVKTGGTPSREVSEYFDGQIPWVKTTEVVNEVIYETSEKISEAGLKASNCEIFPVGTILVAMYGQGLTRGRTAKLGIPATTNQACAAILPTTKINTSYLWTYLKISYNEIRDLGRGGNQPNMNLSMVRDLEIPVPPLSLQEEFAGVVAQVESLRGRMGESTRQVEGLFESLLGEAFS